MSYKGGDNNECKKQGIKTSEFLCDSQCCRTFFVNLAIGEQNQAIEFLLIIAKLFKLFLTKI